MKHFIRQLISLFIITFISCNLSAQTNSSGTLNQSGKNVTADSSKIKSTDSIPYATLYVYRSYIPKINAPLKKVPIFINDTLVHELKVNTVMTLKVFREGKFNIAIAKQSEEQTPFKVKFGKEYFFKCEILGGILNKRTLLYPVTPKFGREESGVLSTE